MIKFSVNTQPFSFEGDPDTPLLWVIRDAVSLKGTKFGCGIGMCGACSVHLDGTLVRSCSVPVTAATGKEITTIEGVATVQSGATVESVGTHQGAAVQQAWIAEAVPQCGYCQSGMIMAAVDLLNRIPDPSDQDIDKAMTNLCRCGTYPRVRKAIHAAASTHGGKQ